MFVDILEKYIEPHFFANFNSNMLTKFDSEGNIFHSGFKWIQWQSLMIIWRAIIATDNSQWRQLYSRLVVLLGGPDYGLIWEVGKSIERNAWVINHLDHGIIIMGWIAFRKG